MAFTRGKVILELALKKMNSTKPPSKTESSSAKVARWLNDINHQQDRSSNPPRSSINQRDVVARLLDGVNDQQDRSPNPPHSSINQRDVESGEHLFSDSGMDEGSLYVPETESTTESESISEVVEFPALRSCENLTPTRPQPDKQQARENQTGRKTRYKKPKRPCPYCDQLMCNLTRHLIRHHKTEKLVEEALKRPTQERNQIFDQLRKDGIMKYNQKVQGGSTGNLMRERNQGKENLIVCGGCNGFFSKRRIYQHKKNCSGDCRALKDFVFHTPACHIEGVTEEFKKEVVSSFRQDAVGKICQSDTAVLLLGDRLWAKSVKREKRVIMSDMRILGNLINRMKDVKGSDFSGEDVLKRANFDSLRNCIVAMTTTETGEMKSGLKLSIGFVLKKLIKVLKGHYIMKARMEEAHEVDLFSSVLEMNWDFIFYSAQVACEVRRTTLRKPSDLPLEKDVKTLRDFIASEMKTMVEDPFKIWDKHDFIKLRNLIVARLTLFNARRGGEPARMLLTDWRDAEAGTWIDQQLVQKVSDPLEASLLSQFKLAYQSGKGGRRLVPVLIPNDTLNPLRTLVEKRAACDVSPENIFLFPSTGNSLEHAQGWNAVRDVSKQVEGLEKPDLLIADKFRHRASTLFALIDIPSEKRDTFYKHMGHSEKVNKDVYQCPLAVKEITQVGRFLDEIDKEASQVETHTCNLNERESSSKRNEEMPSYPDDERQIVTPEIRQEISAHEDQRDIMSDGSEVNHEVTGRNGNAVTQREPNVSEKSPKARRYVKWTDTDWQLVRAHFKSYIEDSVYQGVKGPLPGKVALTTFLRQHSILGSLSNKEKIDILKTKVFNERAKYRKACAFSSV